MMFAFRCVCCYFLSSFHDNQQTNVDNYYIYYQIVILKVSIWCMLFLSFGASPRSIILNFWTYDWRHVIAVANNRSKAKPQKNQPFAENFLLVVMFVRMITSNFKFRILAFDSSSIKSKVHNIQWTLTYVYKVNTWLSKSAIYINFIIDIGAVSDGRRQLTESNGSSFNLHIEKIPRNFYIHKCYISHTIFHFRASISWLKHLLIVIHA